MNIAHYLLQVNLYLVAFYALYILLLAKETYFVINRIYLIAAGILSLVIPYIRLDWFAKAEVHQQFYVSVDQMLSQAVVVTEVEKHFNWGLLIVAVYVFGVLFFTAKLIFKLLHLKKLFKTGINEQAFSFLNKKVVSRSLPQQETINHHENIHIKQLHTLDVLFFEVLGIINWFNPVSYLFKKAVKNIHEYLADEETARLQSDKETYALLLLSHALKVSPNTLTNSFFNKNMLKKRIYMLHKQRSRKTAMLKYGLFVPLFGLTLILSSSTINKNQEILSISNQIPLSNLADVKNALTVPIVVAQSITQSQNQGPKNQKNMKNTLKVAVLALAGLTAHQSFAQKSDTSKVTGAVVKSMDSTSLNNLLHGKVNGVELKKNGDTVKYRKVMFGGIKGNPLFLIDGIEAHKDMLGKIDPAVIYSIEVLKDGAATSLYGDKGKDGVILITTKSKPKTIIDHYINVSADKMPLILLDKRPITANEFNKLDKNSIASAEVLKDATTIYGRKGKNGVIVLTSRPKNTKYSELAVEDDKVYDFKSVEKYPEFPGGIALFYKYVKENLKYPAEAIKNNIQGKVFLSYIIEKNGGLTDINITSGINAECDQEAVRLASNSPSWNPGLKDGKPVRVKYNIPINFKLDK